MTTDESQRLERLRARVERLRLVLAAFAVVAAGALVAAFRPAGDVASAGEDVLRARGLVIEDARGRPRILIGAPLPEVEGRTRDDSASGLLVMDASGTDRVAVGYPTNPRLRTGNGTGRRTSPSAGIAVNDSLGRERGGFGVLDDGRVNLGLDFPTHEGVSLGIVPDWGVAGLMVWGGDEGNPQRVYLGANFDSAGMGPGGLYLNGRNGQKWLRLDRDGGTARMEVDDPTTGETLLDVIDHVRRER